MRAYHLSKDERMLVVTALHGHARGIEALLEALTVEAVERKYPHHTRLIRDVLRLAETIERAEMIDAWLRPD